MPTPRVFLIRHGETAWSLNGRHTGATELELTPNGEKRITATGRALVGADRLIVPAQLAHIYVSPRRRAQRTLQLLGLGCHAPPPWNTDPCGIAESPPSPSVPSTTAPAPSSHQPHVQVTPAVAEWDYGAYEGLTSAQIREQRTAKGEGGWDIWTDGCPDGESPSDVEARLDALIADLRARFHGPAFGNEHLPHDVLIVAHGHILRALAMRWIGRELTSGVALLLEAGGVGTLSYEHQRIEEPAILLGGAFV